MSENYIVRSPVYSCFSGHNSAGFISERTENCILYEGEEAAAARSLWEYSATPIPQGNLLSDDHRGSYAFETWQGVFERLSIARILLAIDEQKAANFFNRPLADEVLCPRLLVCMTGAIQTATFIPFLRALRSSFCKELRIILTESASKLIQRTSLMNHLDAKVYMDPFEELIEGGVPHVMLSSWASCILVAPASASAIYRVAHSTCNDLLSVTVTAAPSAVPIVIAPSMNSNMWTNPGVTNNLALCRTNGYWILEPGLGEEVNTRWNDRTPALGVLGAQPSGLVKVMTAIYATSNSRSGVGSGCPAKVEISVDL